MAEKELWFDVKRDRADVTALKALADGSATADQQQRALEFIVKRIAGEPSVTFTAGMADVTHFLEGRRFVGRMIHSFIVTPVDQLLKGQRNERDGSSGSGSRTGRRAARSQPEQPG